MRHTKPVFERVWMAKVRTVLPSNNHSFSLERNSKIPLSFFISLNGPEFHPFPKHPCLTEAWIGHRIAQIAHIIILSEADQQ